MATLGEYGSLLQLGFGIGIGLSVFRAPMDLIAAKLKSDLDAEFGVLENVSTSQAAIRRGKLFDLQIKFANTSLRLESFHLPFMIASILIALVNWVLLACGSSLAQTALSLKYEVLLIFVSGPIYLLISTVLCGATFVLLYPIRSQLDAIRSE